MRDLCAEWIAAKTAEMDAIERRREIEDLMAKRVDGNGKGGHWPGYKVKIAARDNWKIDSDRLQEIAEATGLTDHLPRLFRWKPEVNMSLWKASDEAVTRPLLDAITITPGRPSFTITKE